MKCWVNKQFVLDAAFRSPMFNLMAWNLGSSHLMANLDSPVLGEAGSSMNQMYPNVFMTLGFQMLVLLSLKLT